MTDIAGAQPAIVTDSVMYIADCIKKMENENYDVFTPKRDAEEEAKRESEEQAKREAEEQAGCDAEETATHEAEDSFPTFAP